MKDWKNSQVINLLTSNKNEGNCFAFAALFKIFANQLNSNAVICTAPQHIYIQHQDHKGDWYNVELATAGHPTDGSIQTLTYTTNKALMNDIALRNLDEKQSVALCLVNLAKSYEHKYNNPTADFLLQCAALALQHDPKNLNALLLKQQVLDAKVVAYARTNKINTIEKLRNNKEINGQLTQLEKHLAHLSNLGYIQMPVDMQEIVLNGFKGEHTAQFIKKDKNPSPFTSIAVPEKENHYVDVSHGLFQEVFAPKAIEIYGHFALNTQQGKLTQLDTTTINHQLIDPVAFAYDFGARVYDARLGRMLSLDPATSIFPWYSPYQFAGNKPIWAIDQDGLEEFFRTDYFNAAGNLYKTEVRMVTQLGADKGQQTVHHSAVREVINVNGNSSFNVSWTGSTIGTTQGANAFQSPLDQNALLPNEIKQKALKVNSSGTPNTRVPVNINVTTTDIQGNVTIKKATQGQLIPATTGGIFNVGFVKELFDNAGTQLGFQLRSPNNPKSGFQMFGGSQNTITFSATNDNTGTFAPIIPPNSPSEQNAVPLFNDGLFRTVGSNFGLGVNHARAKGINNNSEASDKMFFNLLRFVIETSTGINLTDGNTQE